VFSIDRDDDSTPERRIWTPDSNGTTPHLFLICHLLRAAATKPFLNWRCTEQMVRRCSKCDKDQEFIGFDNNFVHQMLISNINYKNLSVLIFLSADFNNKCKFRMSNTN
jgi:hypothetical protein